MPKQLHTHRIYHSSRTKHHEEVLAEFINSHGIAQSDIQMLYRETGNSKRICFVLIYWADKKLD